MKPGPVSGMGSCSDLESGGEESKLSMVSFTGMHEFKTAAVLTDPLDPSESQSAFECGHLYLKPIKIVPTGMINQTPFRAGTLNIISSREYWDNADTKT